MQCEVSCSVPARIKDMHRYLRRQNKPDHSPTTLTAAGGVCDSSSSSMMGGKLPCCCLAGEPLKLQAVKHVKRFHRGVAAVLRTALPPDFCWLGGGGAGAPVSSLADSHSCCLPSLSRPASELKAESMREVVPACACVCMCFAGSVCVCVCVRSDG